MKNKLRIFRAMNDLTQETLAQELGVTRQTIVSLENGKYDPSIGLAFKTARLFGVKIEDVFIYDEEEGLPSMNTQHLGRKLPPDPAGDVDEPGSVR